MYLPFVFVGLAESERLLGQDVPDLEQTSTDTHAAVFADSPHVESVAVARLARAPSRAMAAAYGEEWRGTRGLGMSMSRVQTGRVAVTPRTMPPASSTRGVSAEGDRDPSIGHGRRRNEGMGPAERRRECLRLCFRLRSSAWLGIALRAPEAPHGTPGRRTVTGLLHRRCRTRPRPPLKSSQPPCFSAVTA